MSKKYLLTKNGLKKMEKELEELKYVRRRELLKDTPVFEGDDLNQDFLIYKENQELLDMRIDELENVLKHYEVIKKPKENGAVCVGASISLEDNNSQKKIFEIVGTLEADPFSGKISDESPIGKQFLGKKVGDVVSLGNSRIKYKILKIDYKNI